MASDPEPTTRRAKRQALVVLALATTGFGLLLVPAYHAVVASALIFDAPEADRYTRLTAFGVALVSYPVITLLSIPASWALFALKKYRAALWASFLPLLPMLAILLTFLLLES